VSPPDAEVSAQPLQPMPASPTMGTINPTRPLLIEETMRHLATVSFIAFAVLGCRPDNDEPAPTCTYDGVGYAANESFGATDGCNTCWCEASGAVACTRI